MLNIHSPKEELIHAMDASLIESIISEKGHPGLELIEHDGLFILNTGIHSPDMNGIFQGHNQSRDIVESVEYGIHYFKKKEIPYYWWVGKYRNPDLRELLEDSGYEHVADLPVMVADLMNLPNTVKLANIQCKLVQTKEEFEAFISISSLCIELTSESEIEYRNYNLHNDFMDTLKQDMYLAYWDGIPAASCITFKSDEIISLYFIATLPQYRNRGLGRAVTLYAMKKAIEQGYLVAGLQATAMGLSLYEGLGFTTISNEYIYALS
jgi:GNAT superfamily N-acetyltransferase